MSSKSKYIAVGFTIAVISILLLGLVAAGAYLVGRNSAAPAESTEAAPALDDAAPTSTVAGPAKSGEQEESLGGDGELPVQEEGPALAPIATDAPAEPGESGIESAASSGAVMPRTLELTQEDLELMIEVWELIESEFDGAVPSEKDVLYGAINGSVELLDDRFTRFVPAAAAERAREQLEGGFEGIGAYVDLTDDGLLLIVRPIEGQPADLAGLKSGDLVTHVNGDSVLHKSLDEIVNEVRGPKGTDVTLTIEREGLAEPFDVTITRDLIIFPIVTSELLEQDVAYVRLFSFSATAFEQLHDAVALILQQEPKGLILDLRDNPGGFLNQSVEVADIFLGDGIVLFQRDSRGDEEVFRSDSGDSAETIPLAVLVNAGSASASEIVAGAIQDHGRGVVIGETTLGKGSVQRSYTLSDGSELRVTIARWFTPNNLSISETGIAPDIEVETPDEFGGETDTQLQRAIDFIINGK